MKYLKSICRKKHLWFKTHSLQSCIVLSLLLFPFINGLINKIPYIHNIGVSVPDQLAYYGTAFGIIGSYWTYLHEKKKEKIQRETDLQPFFTVELRRNKTSPDIFEISVCNHSENKYTGLYLYDEYVSAYVDRRYCFSVTYLKSRADAKNTDAEYNITSDSDILDSDGYPKYIQLVCNDTDGNCWNCCYFKTVDGNHLYYYAREIEIA